MSSRTPSDDFTPDLGSSFLLPDFSYDGPYNEGVEDGARLPEAYGLAELPDGVVQATEERYDVPEGVEMDEAGGMDLGELGMVATSDLPGSDLQEMTDRHQDDVPDITDLSWLSDATQDPERLPSLDTNQVIPELVEAWGTRTDGLQRIEATDLSEINAREAAESDEPNWKFTNEQLRSVLAGAMRRSAAGISLAQIKQEVIQLLGHEAVRLATPMRAVENEHGLVGNVYVRASAYPGLIHGKWAKHIKKTHKSARYLIACGNCDACKGGEAGSCACNAKLGLKSVAKINWDYAYKHYAKLLEATGRLDRTATVKDKRLTLKQAFSRREAAPTQAIEQVFPTHKAPVERVSKQEAREALAALKATEREVLTNDSLTVAAKRKRVAGRLGHLVKASLLSLGEAKKLMASKTHPDAILKKAQRIITARHTTSEYTGDGRLPKMASDSESVEALAAHSTEHKAHMEANQTAGVDGESIRQVESMVRWTRQKMSEGMTGRDLSDLMAGRWSETLIKAASTQLVQIRKKHEGLAGHLYVDAAAYASSKGITGCEKSASLHRANGIPTVLEMSRCGSCTARNEQEDGTAYCQKYNKPLVDSAPVDDPRGFQAEQIRLANASDAEVTAALFTNPAAEFGLHNDVLDEFDVGGAPEQIVGFAFGGIDLSDG